MATKPNIGQRVKQLRQHAGISQMDLELQIDASPGSISRIECGKVNPTKETLFKIASALDLEGSYYNYLFGIQPLAPTTQEIEKIISKVQPYLDQNLRPGYLADMRYKAWTWNSSILKILEVNSQKANTSRGENVLKILLKSKFNIIAKVPKLYLLKFMIDQLNVYRQMIKYSEFDPDVRQDIDDLNAEASFVELWEKYKDTTSTVSPSINFYLKYKNKDLSIRVVHSKLFFDNRFMLVEYYPLDQLTADVFKDLIKRN